MAKHKVTISICPVLQAQGICTDTSCPHEHDLFACQQCKLYFDSHLKYDGHLTSRQHQSRVTQIERGYTQLFCDICKKRVPSVPNAWDTHVAGRAHCRAAAAQGVATNGGPIPIEDTEHIGGYCPVCDRHILQELWTNHNITRQHMIRAQFSSLKSALDEAEKDKHGVSVTGETNFGILESSEGVQGRQLHLTVSTAVPSARISIVDVKLSSAQSRTPSTSFNAGVNMRTVTYSKPATLTITFREAKMGHFTDRVEVILEDTLLSKSFFIVRSIRAIVGSRADHELLRPRAPYVPRTRVKREPETEVIPGERPPALKVIPWVVKLPDATIPPHVSNALSYGQVQSMVAGIRSAFLPPALNGDTYGQHFGTLLWCEEYRMDRDLEIYDITDATLRSYRTYYYLEVPGLAEKRPSVLVGDRILVQKHGDTRGKWYEGNVHIVHEMEVGLRFDRSFPWSAVQRYSIHFKLNRYPVRRQHQALTTVFHPDRILFPTSVHVQGMSVPSAEQMRLRLYNRSIATNPPQLQAVASIMSQKPGSPPFAIFGPPGTGKTVTMREAIRQILRANPNARIFACAPSNSAADLIAQGLLELGTDEMFRFYAPSRRIAQVPDNLKPYTSMFSLRGGSAAKGGQSYTSNYDLHFSVPPMARLRRFRVVISTCVSAAMPYGVGLPRGHFSHIFIDEAGQATEPEVMIPIKTMADNSTNVVLSGDHKQLGPIIRSAVARELGLEKSFLERLMEREEYDELGGHGRTVVKLVKNFRSHKSILSFPNERFYRGDLQQFGDPAAINAFIGSLFLPAKNFPIIFHGIAGQDMREASSPSFFNIEEVTLVREYVEKLRANRQVRITDHDIGIIAPYHAQCQKLRARLRGIADDVKIGSVEEFQGQERKVIILSTVRSSKEFINYDIRHTLGFVASPRRFNVSVTRAKALLIVVGDPAVLSLDPLWRNFMNYVYNNGGWKGALPMWNTREDVDEAGGYDKQARELAMEDMNEFSRRLAALTLDNADGDGGGELEAGVDKPWRDVE